MSDTGLSPADDWSELLSALLDGELGPDEEARVRAHLQATPGGEAELDELARVRSMVRDLPAVDPPFGFYERLLRESRRPRHTGLKALSAVAAAAAAVVLVVGVTPATDAVVPPVAAYAARHEEMAPMAELAVPASTTTPGPGTVPAPPSGADPAGGFEALEPAELDQMGAPAVLTGTFRRMSGYEGTDGTMHLVYSDGLLVVSVYEQAGVVAWEQLPSGTMTEVEGAPAWSTDDGAEHVLVVERGPTVYTVVVSAGPRALDGLRVVAADLPEAPEPSMLDRFRTGCHSVPEQFSVDP